MTQDTIPGRFVHFDLMTTDLERSKAFFTELFGWQVNTYDIPGAGAYPMFKNGVREFGGIVPLDSSSGQSSHWMIYIGAPDVDAVCERAAARGATLLLPPTDISGGYGRYAVLADPQGAVFAVYTGPEGAPAENGAIEAGSVDWNELVTDAPVEAAAFYGDLFGYQAEVMNGGGPAYTVLSTGGMPVGGILSKSHEMNMPASVWMTYFRVDDIEATAAEITRLGGKLYSPVFEVEPNGKFAWAADPTGAAFNLHQPAASTNGDALIGK